MPFVATTHFRLPKPPVIGTTQDRRLLASLWDGAEPGSEPRPSVLRAAAIGTAIAPGLGTAIGGTIVGLVGGVAGYFGGGALGKWLYNSL